MKFKYFADMFLKIGSNEWKKSTYSKYSIIVNHKLNFLFDRDINSIKASELRLWFSDLKNTLSGKTLRDYRSCLNQIFLLAKYDDEIKLNPIEFVKNPALIKPKIQPFSASEVIQILEISKKYQIKYQIFLKIGFFTGMRTGEILALKKSNIDLENRTINILKSRSRYGENTPKTFGSIRIIPINDFIYDDLKNYVLNLQSDYLFINQYGQPYNCVSSFLKYFWKPILKELNLPYRKLYTMRHTFATNILKNANLTPYELSKQLGHNSTEMVFNRYVKFIESENEKFKTDIKIY
ncbi:MAG: site-specific integrase [Campylobacter sp.]|nr:site-specific integrase [Campylobacter sp.]